jgi:hypothetical protein
MVTLVRVVVLVAVFVAVVRAVTDSDPLVTSPLLLSIADHIAKQTPKQSPVDTNRRSSDGVSIGEGVLARQDREALEAVFRDGGGLFWTSRAAVATWMNSSVAHCSWEGVACEEEPGGGPLRVRQLIMAGFGVTEISESVAALDRLAVLDVSNNKLSGTIPGSLGRLRSLEQLYLESNRIETLPEELFQLANLTCLYLDSNALTGALSESLGNLKALKSLYINSNRLTSLPASLGDLVELTVLKVHSNQITSRLPDMSRLTKLVTLSLSDNAFELPLPDLSGLSQLASLALSNCGLVSLPPLPMGSLRSIEINGNRLEGELHLCGPAIEAMYSNDNPGLKAIGPAIDPCLPSLLSINVANTGISSIDFLRQSPRLTDVDLSGTRLGSQPLDLARAMTWPSLQSLRADNVGIVMPIAEVFASLLKVKTLLSLDLSYNPGIAGPLDSASLERAGVWKGEPPVPFPMLILRLSGTSLERFGTGVERLFPNVRVLSLRDTKDFDPVLPVNLQRWQHLKSMDIVGTNPAVVIPGPARQPGSPVAVDVNSSSLCPTTLTGGALSSYSITADPRASNFSLCQCMDETYGEPRRGCLECPEPPAGETTVKIDCFTSPGKLNVTGGWFNFVNGRVAVVACPSDTAFNPCGWNVLAYTVRTLEDWETVSTRFNSSCATGYRGRLCSKCRKGFFRSGRRCYSCGGRTLSWLNPLSSLLILTALGVKKVTGERSRSGLLRTLTMHAQLVTLLPDMSLRISDWSSFFIKSSGSGAGGLRLNGLECEGIAGWDGFYAPFVQAALFPVIVAVGSAWIAAVSWLVVRNRGAAAPPFVERFKGASLYLWLVLLFGSMQRLMAPLNCTDYGSTHGTMYLTQALWITCKGPSFGSLLGAGAVLGFGYIILTIALMAYRLRPSSPGSSAISLFLRSPYRSECYYWEAVQLVRRVALAMASSLTKLNSPLQPAIVSSVLILGLLAHTWRKPYVRPLDNVVESMSLTILLGSYMGGLIVSNPRFPSSATALISWLFFAFNAVFLVTLTIAVLFVTAQKGLESLRRYRGKAEPRIIEGDDDEEEEEEHMMVMLTDSKTAPLLARR